MKPFIPGCLSQEQIRIMIKELLNVLKVLEPRHLLKAVFHPVEELQKFKYHYRRVAEDEFVMFLAHLPEMQRSRLDDITQDLTGNHAFRERLNEKLKEHKDGYGGQMTREASAVYALVRLLKPRIVVETGVADGFTSSHILRALEDNGEGRLYSIDLPHYLLPPGKEPGWIVEEALRARWSLMVGKAEELLPPLLEELGTIDVFLHDSLHTYEHMLFEFGAAWPHLKPGGLLLSHDVGQNASFFDFTEKNGIGWRDWRVFHVLGGFRKPGESGK
jgi:predicted O-methyltransferase YrrM